jgi:hypothetical protein
MASKKKKDAKKTAKLRDLPARKATSVKGGSLGGVIKGVGSGIGGAVRGGA